MATPSITAHRLEGHRPTGQEQDGIPGKFEPVDSDLVSGNDQSQMAPGFGEIQLWVPFLLQLNCWS